MAKFMVKVIFIYLICFIFLALLPLGTGLKASGIVIEDEAVPGQHLSNEITISTDKSENPMDFQVDVMDWVQGPNGENRAVNESEQKVLSARSFLKVSPTNFHLEPGDSQKILVNGNVPNDVGSGGRYAIIDAHTISSGSKNGGNSLGISYSLNTIVRITIAGSELIRTAEISKLNIDQPISNKQQNVTMVFNNTGNIHYEAQPEIILKDKDNNTIADDIAPVTNNILPFASRIISLSLKPGQALKAGIYSVNGIVRLTDGTILATKSAKLDIT